MSEGSSSKGSSSSSSAAAAAGMAIEKMYTIYEKLNSAEDKTKLEPEYRQFLDAAHRSDKEKRLASQFITRFVEYFPELYNDAANAMLDLCEEDDPIIRKQVLKDLITVCKKVKICVPKIADVFCQLMLTADAAELTNLQNGLISLFLVDARGTLAGIFSQIASGEELVRDTCLKFLATRLKDLSPEVATEEFQKALYFEIRNIIKWITEDEFNILMDVLMKTKLVKQVGGNELIVELLYDMIDLGNMPDVSIHAHMFTILYATDYAFPLLTAQNPTNRLVVYYFTKVFSQWQTLKESDPDLVLQKGLLRHAAELLLVTTTLSDSEVQQCLTSALELAMEILPPAVSPPEATEVDADVQEVPLPDFNFSFCECALFFINKLGSFRPELLSKDSHHEELRKRMLLLNRGVTAFESKLKSDFKGHMQNENKKDLQMPENRNKIISFKAMKNLNTFIRELYQKPPKFNATVLLSWKPLKPGKRAANPADISIAAKSAKFDKDREIQRYQPPSGKYSRGAAYGAAATSNRGGRGWNRGSFRGRRRF